MLVASAWNGKGDLEGSAGTGGESPDRKLGDSDPGFDPTGALTLGKLFSLSGTMLEGTRLLSFPNFLSAIQRHSPFCLVPNDLSWGWNKGLSNAFLKSLKSTGDPVKDRPQIIPEPKDSKQSSELGSWVGWDRKGERWMESFQHP